MHRIVAVSDLHGYLPKIPPCDLLLIGGDLCPDRFGLTLAHKAPQLQRQWFEHHFVPWVSRQPARRVVMTWGNHDWCGHLYPEGETVLLRHISVVTDALVEWEGLRLWCTPWSNQFMTWAFMREPEALTSVYAQIPAQLDVLMSHQPPQGYGDRIWNLATGREEHIGSAELLAQIDRVRPRVVVCGHLHNGFGRYVREGMAIYNVSVVNEAYQLVNPATEFSLEGELGR